MCDQVKSMKNNEKMVATFTNMAQLVNQQMSQVDSTKMAEQMQMFNEKMDEAVINDKMMQELMNSNEAVDTNVDSMMDVLKQEIALEDKNNINIVNPNTEVNYNAPQSNKKEEEAHDPFLDQLKGL